MEDILVKNYSYADSMKQKEIIIEFMNSVNFAHPVLEPFLHELKLTAEELQGKHIDEHRLGDQETRKLHQEARRLAKIEILAEVIQARKVLPCIASKSKLSMQNSPLKNNKSYKSILESQPDVPLSIPLNQISGRMIELQKKKLERLLKVSENIKQIQFENEKRKIEIVNELEEKNEKIRINHILLEEERNKRNNEIESKRQKKLVKKHEVIEMQQICQKEKRALQEPKSQKTVKNVRSKTSLHMRSTRNDE